MEVSKHAPGSLCWAEIGTTNSPAAKRFYTELFNWQARDVDAGESETYTLMQLDGRTRRKANASTARCSAGSRRRMTWARRTNRCPIR